MAEMPVAVRTAHFGADHAVAGVADFVDRIDVDRRGEAGPARSAVIFFLGIEQFRAAARAIIDAVGLVAVIFAGEGPFRAAFPQDMILFGGKALAPFGVGQVELVHARPYGDGWTGDQAVRRET